MPSAKALRAGKAVIDLSLTGSKNVQAGLRKIEKMANNIGDGIMKVGRGLSAVGGAITTPFAGAVAIFGHFGDELQKTSDRTGVSVESLSELGYAADQSGASLAVVEKGIRGMSRMLLDASRGSKTATDNLADLGLEL